ncbi:hypothetical protein OEZ86_010359 [Tetradesmus obliquus]|nr:hypothetical protein OEZ86_010359 [Tetradesmus obliquus]
MRGKGKGQVARFDALATLQQSLSAQLNKPKLIEEVWVQCDKPNCKKWRKLPPGSKAPPDNVEWDCSLNPDPYRNSCDIPEEDYSDDDWEQREEECKQQAAAPTQPSYGKVKQQQQFQQYPQQQQQQPYQQQYQQPYQQQQQQYQSELAGSRRRKSGELYAAGDYEWGGTKKRKRKAAAPQQLPRFFATEQEEQQQLAVACQRILDNAGLWDPAACPAAAAAAAAISAKAPQPAAMQLALPLWMVDSASKDVEDAAAAPGLQGVEAEQLAEPHTGRTSWPVAACHIVTVFLGPGVLALPYITSRLGWAGSTAGLLCCFCLTLWTSGLLADVYQVDGRRHGRYDIAVCSILGKRHGLFLVISQHVNLTLANIGFQIAAADACSVIAGTICRSRSNSTPLLAAGQCWNNRTVLTVAVGVAQLLLSQMRNLQAARVTSAVGGAAAVVFCIITLGLAASKAGNRRGTLTGYNAPAAAKVLSAFNALGSICFGLNAPIITLEVADTLRQPPAAAAAAAAAAAMKKSLVLGLGTCLLLFALCGGLGYAALGDGVSGNLLLAYQDDAPAWVIILGSLMVVLSMVLAYQVCCQPTFAARA